MFLLRIGKQHKWAGAAQDPGAARVAAEDLALREGEHGLSVFALETPQEAREVAVRHAMTNQRGAKPVDFIAFPESLVLDLGLEVVATTDDRLDPALSYRHREIRGLTPDLAELLARAILASTARSVDRVPKDEIDRLGVELCRADSELRRRLKPAWDARITPLL